MSDMALELDEVSRSIIDLEVAEGRYDSPAAVIRSALRLLKARDRDLAALGRAIDEGDESGDPVPIDFEAFIADKLGADPHGG